MKNRQVGAELFQSDGRADTHGEANSRFSQICERAQKTSCTFRLMCTDNTKGMNHRRITLT